MARRSTRTPTCQDCYFGRSGLCALPEPSPCTTFRPYHPDGLRPPQQLRLTFRSERRARAAWAFPTAQQQADRYGHDHLPPDEGAPVYGLPAPDPEPAPCRPQSPFSERVPRGRTATAPAPGISRALAGFAY